MQQAGKTQCKAVVVTVAQIQRIVVLFPIDMNAGLKKPVKQYKTLDPRSIQLPNKIKRATIVGTQLHRNRYIYTLYHLGHCFKLFFLYSAGVYIELHRQPVKIKF